ncbi:MAG: alpha/beta fold hydrolase [Candidatus Lokiarchaeota archaeon]|nr:alpha/beta fold hydrolase [Candidatus Lokiarchaeota archaeon]
MIRLSNKWIQIIKKVLLIAGLVPLIIGLIIGLTFNIFLIPSNIEHFQLETAPEFTFFGEEFEFDCMLMQPKSQFNHYGTERPAIVMVHGFMSSKMYFKGLAYEFNRRGFVVLAITAPGHSASGGGFSPTWENATLSAVKYLRDYSEILHIDKDRISLIGHSMGAFSVTLAGVIDRELGNNWINSTIAVGGPFLNITEGFGEGFSTFLGIPYVYPNLWYDSEVAIQNAVIEGRTNDTKPYNYMNIIGDKDQAFSLNSAYELVYGSSSPAFWSAQGVNNKDEIVGGKTYGRFNGTARKLVVLPGIGHIIEGQQKTTFVQAINWTENSMKLKTESGYPGELDLNTITEDIRVLSIPLMVIGSLIMLLPLTIYIGNWLKSKENKAPENSKEVKSKKMWMMFLIYGLSFVGVSFLAAPIIHATGLVNLMPTDFLASNIISLPLLVQGLLMVPVLIVLGYIENKKFNIKLNDIGLVKKPKSNMKNALYAIFLVLFLYIFLNLALSGSMHNLLIWRVFSFLQLFITIFVAMIIFEIMFRGMIQNKLSRYRKETLIFIPAWKELLLSSIVSGLIEGLGLGIIITGVLIYGGMPLDLSSVIPQDMGISFGAMPPLFIVIPGVFIILEMVLNFLKSWIFRKSNNNIIASALFVALFLAWFLSVILPATSIYAPRFVFLT